MSANSQYNKKLRRNANQPRKSMTKAEASLWKYVLSKRNIKGHQFRRQRPINQFIVDFVCLPLKLIIEVDGITHTYAEVAENDTKRQQQLESLGYFVIRFTDEEVLTAIDRVYQNILAEVERLELEIG